MTFLLPNILQTVVDFSLSDQVYARAKVENVDSVGLWLGAGVMVEYDLDDAKALLVSTPSMSNCGADSIHNFALERRILSSVQNIGSLYSVA